MIIIEYSQVEEFDGILVEWADDVEVCGGIIVEWYS